MGRRDPARILREAGPAYSGRSGDSSNKAEDRVTL